MTRRQRAIACAIGIIPTSVAGIALVRCRCSVAAYTIEVATALAYILFILATPRNRGHR
jgi:hypothetical protein